MAKIEFESIINNRTLNIFTDASISKYNGITTGCAGAEYYMGGTYLYSDTKVLFNTTNNQSELMSILLGVYGAMQNRHFVDTINLFSDSKISVYGLREWIFSWIHNSWDGVMYNSSGQVVANQGLILSIIDTITRNRLKINIFHIRGHKNCDSAKDIDEFRRSFIKENHLPNGTTIDTILLQFLMAGNDNIDKYSRQKLYDKEYMDLLYSHVKDNVQPFTIDPRVYMNMIDFNIYKELIGA